MVPNAVAIVTCEVEFEERLKRSALYVTFALSVNGAIMKQYLKFQLDQVWIEIGFSFLVKMMLCLIFYMFGWSQKNVLQQLTGVVVINLGVNNKTKDENGGLLFFTRTKIIKKIFFLIVRLKVFVKTELNGLAF